MIFKCKCGAIFGKNVYKHEVDIKKFAVHAPVVGKLKQYEIEHTDKENIYRHYALNTLNELYQEYANGKYKYIKPYETYLKLIKTNKIKVLKVATIDEFAKDHFLDEEIEKCKLYDTFSEVGHMFNITKKGKKAIIVGSADKIIVEDKHKRLVILDTKIDQDGSFCYKYVIHYTKLQTEPIEPKVDVTDEYTILKCPVCGDEVARIRHKQKF